MKEVNTQSLWTFDLGTQGVTNVPLWIIVGFKQRVRPDSQILNNERFYRPPGASVQCIIGTEKYLDSAILVNYDDDDYSQGYGQIKEVSRALTKDDILNLYTFDHISDRLTLITLERMTIAFVKIFVFLIYDVRKM